MPLGLNTCSPGRIFGPAVQVLFCGCSVNSFSVGAGWNEQGSNVVVELVYDSCIGPRIYWDEDLIAHREEMADPGFMYPEPGCAAYFRMPEEDALTEDDLGGFEYCGIIQGWTEKRDSNGNPIFTVTLTDPRIILENTQVIVNNYPGNTENVWNLLNAYGFVESLGTTCLVSEALGIGGTTLANSVGNITNARGMPWADFRAAVHALTSSVNVAQFLNSYSSFCKNGRLVYVGPRQTAPSVGVPLVGYGILDKDFIISDPSYSTLPNTNMNHQVYTVDLSEIPFSPLDYRISGPTISLAEAISQVCADAGCDYYVELLPVRNVGTGFNSTILKTIKVRVSARGSQPTTNVLDDYLAAKASQASSAGGGVIAYTRGAEVRNEETSIYVIGAKKREPFVVERDSSDAYIIPYWGLDADGNLIAATKSDQYYVSLDTRKLNLSLNTSIGGYISVSEAELRASLQDIDSFKAVVFSPKGAGDLATHLTAININSFVDFDALPDVAQGNVPQYSHINPLLTDGDSSIKKAAADDLDKIYEFIKNYTSEYYGKQFLVKAPGVCYATDPENGKKIFSHEPSTEGCWVNDNVPTILGLTHNSTASDFFRDDTGKYQAILQYSLSSCDDLSFNDAYIADISKIGADNYIADDVSDKIWVKAQIEPEWYIGTPLNPSAVDNLYFLFKISEPVQAKYNDANNPDANVLESFSALETIAAGTITTQPLNTIGRGNLLFAMLNKALLPESALCPTLFNVDVYGPWGVAGLPGQVTAVVDDGLAPWEYGSDQIMELAGLDKVTTAVTQMRKGERGSITLAGFPNIPIGAELMAVDTASPPLSQTTQKYVHTRTYSISAVTASVTVYTVQMNSWNGSYGPSITQVNVQVGPNGFVTTYEFSTYTPQPGRFNKDNAERLKQIGQQRLANNRNLRAALSISRTNYYNSALSGGAKGSPLVNNQIAKSARVPAAENGVIVARYTNTGRIDINTQSVRSVSYAIDTGNYDGCAIVSYDTLFSPVSITGGGGLPRLARHSGTYRYISHAPDPPTGTVNPVAWPQKYLNPFTNPSGDANTDLSDSPSEGHHMEIVARDTGIAKWSVQDDQYSEDYRFLAIRGPIMIQSWGHDIESKPIPNARDSEDAASSGNFANSGLLDKFLPGWLQKPKTWPVAPLDLAFDRQRGVWTVPQSPRIIHGNITGCIETKGPFDLPVTNIKVPHDFYNGITTGIVRAIWPWDINPPSGVGKMPVYYDSWSGINYIFPINKLDVDINTGLSNNTGNVIYARDIKRLVFGSGLYASDVNTGVYNCYNTIGVSLVPYTGCGIPYVDTSGIPTSPASGLGSLLGFTPDGCLARVSLAECSGDTPASISYVDMKTALVSQDVNTVEQLVYDTNYTGWNIDITGATTTIYKLDTLSFLGSGGTSLYLDSGNNIVFSGHIDGVGEPNQVTYWYDHNTITGNNNFTYNEYNDTVLDITASNSQTGKLIELRNYNGNVVAGIDYSGNYTGTSFRFADGTIQYTAYTGYYINVTGTSDLILSNQTVTFTGGGSNTVTYDSSTNTITISGSQVGGPGGGFDFNLAAGNEASTTISSGETVSFTGFGNITVTRNSNEIRISGTDTNTLPTVNGTGTTNQLSYWSSSSTITGTPYLYVNSGLVYTGIIRQSGEIVSTGTGIAINLNNGNHQTISLSGAGGSATVTMTVPRSSSAGTIVLIQDSPARNITWGLSTGTIKWMGGQPTWTGDPAYSLRVVAWRWAQNNNFMYLAPTDTGV